MTDPRIRGVWTRHYVLCNQTAPDFTYAMQKYTQRVRTEVNRAAVTISTDMQDYKSKQQEMQLLRLARNPLFISSFIGQDIFPSTSSSNEEVSHSYKTKGNLKSSVK